MLAAWKPIPATRLRDDAGELTIVVAGDGLVHLDYITGGCRVRQICTFHWLVERLLAGGVRVASGGTS